MILEAATFTIKPGGQDLFEAAYAQAQTHLVAAAGYCSHVLRRGIETPNRYLLLVHWETLLDHTEGFRNSEDFANWRRLIGGFFESPPRVEHYQALDISRRGAP